MNDDCAVSRAAKLIANVVTEGKRGLRTMTTVPQGFEELFVTQRSGLRLYGRHYPPNAAARIAPAAIRRRPLVCLAGLTRNGRDFHELALALSQGDDARSVYTLDYRGRGLSDHDAEWRNYSVPMEMQDVIDVLIAQGLSAPAILGTSRGGLIAMVLAAAQPSFVGPVILNDIGPVIEPKGLARIATYVGRTPLPRTWVDAAKLVRDMNARAFPATPETDWEAIARQLFNDRNGRPAPGYDPKLANAFSLLNGPVPAMWAQFESLLRLPLMVIRGANSDILSAETVVEMQRRHPAFTAIEIAGEGHAPWLRDPSSIAAIRRFLASCDTDAVPRLH